MEAIANILMGTSNNQQPHRREPRENAMPLQASNEHEPTEEKNNRFQIRSDQAIAEEWNWNEDPPEPQKCEFCGKTLYHIGIISPLQRKQIFTWLKEPEHCDCEKAKAYWAKVDAERIAAEEEKKRQEETARIQRRINKLIKDSGIRGRFLNRTFERFEIDEYNRKAYEAAERYADAFPAMLPKKIKDGTGYIEPPEIERNGLFITGNYGTGKTHLATAISNQLINGGIPVICMTMIDLLARIKQTFDRSDNATEAEVMKIYEEVPLLVIDDIGSEQPSEWAISTIYNIINGRYEEYMPIIITTNYDTDTLITRMTPKDGGDSVTAQATVDRLIEMCNSVVITGQS